MEKINISGWEELHDNFEDFLEGKKKGTIVLAEPVADITAWYGNQAPYSLISGLSKPEIDKVVYYTGWLVTDAGETDLAEGSVLSEQEYKEAMEKYGRSSFSAGQGAAAVDAFIKKFDAKVICRELRKKEIEQMQKLEKFYDEDPEEGWEDEAARYRAELADVRARIDAAVFLCKNPDSFLIREITLFPLQLRTMLRELSESVPYGVLNDLDSLYGSVASRVSRLKRLKEIDAPEIILRNESRILQENVDALLANGMRGEAKTKGDGHALFCLGDVLTRSIKVF